MGDLTDNEKRVLTAALVSEGRIILWVLGDGRFMRPSLPGDLKDAVQRLESAGLLVERGESGRRTGAQPARAVGSYVFELTAKGLEAAKEAAGRKDLKPPKLLHSA